MKKIFAVVAMAVAAVMSVNNVNAQTESRACQKVHSWSIKPSVGFAGSFLYNNKDNTDMRPGLTAGVETQYMFNKWFGLSDGVNFTQQGGKESASGDGWSAKATEKLDYVGVPILANFYVAKGLALKAGVQPNFLANSKVTLDTFGGAEGAGSYDPKIRNFDAATVLGISYEKKNFVTELRANVGTIGIRKNMKDNDAKNPCNGSITLTVGYRF